MTTKACFLEMKLYSNKIITLHTTVSELESVTGSKTLWKGSGTAGRSFTGPSQGNVPQDDGDDGGGHKDGVFRPCLLILPPILSLQLGSICFKSGRSRLQCVSSILWFWEFLISFQPLIHIDSDLPGCVSAQVSGYGLRLEAAVDPATVDIWWRQWWSATLAVGPRLGPHLMCFFKNLASLRFFFFFL